jgi:sugar phosphate isomerase/epimerase
MVKIFVPTMAAFKGDIQTMMDLLDSTVGKRYEVGLEVIGKPEHFQGTEYFDKIRENLKSVANGVPRVVHGFSGLQVYESGMADMRTLEGRRLLKTYLGLAREIGADYVHVHSGAGYRRIGTCKEKGMELNKVRLNLLGCLKESNATCQIGIENLPAPSMGDVEKNPEKIWCDCVESVEDLLYVIQGTKLKATFDTCHHAANREGEIDLVEPALQLGEYLHYLHVSDVSDFWKPNESVWREGVIPGDGNIGKESFRKFFGYIKENHPDIGIEIEVYNTDFKNPTESKEAITRVLTWLES